MFGFETYLIEPEELRETPARRLATDRRVADLEATKNRASGAEAILAAGNAVEKTRAVLRERYGVPNAHIAVEDVFNGKGKTKCVLRAARSDETTATTRAFGSPEKTTSRREARSRRSRRDRSSPVDENGRCRSTRSNARRIRFRRSETASRGRVRLSANVLPVRGPVRPAERRAPVRRPTSRDRGIMFWRSPGLVQASPVEVRLFGDRDDRAIFASVPTSYGAHPEARSEQRRDASALSRSTGSAVAMTSTLRFRVGSEA